MNYIKRLEEENRAQDVRIADMQSALRAFKREITGPKFVGVDVDGGRKDWMATGDINSRLDEILLNS